MWKFDNSLKLFFSLPKLNDINNLFSSLHLSNFSASNVIQQNGQYILHFGKKNKQTAIHISTIFPFSFKRNLLLFYRTYQAIQCELLRKAMITSRDSHLTLLFTCAITIESALKFKVDLRKSILNLFLDQDNKENKHEEEEITVGMEIDDNGDLQADENDINEDDLGIDVEFEGNEHHKKKKKKDCDDAFVKKYSKKRKEFVDYIIEEFDTSSTLILQDSSLEFRFFLMHLMKKIMSRSGIVDYLSPFVKENMKFTSISTNTIYLFKEKLNRRKHLEQQQPEQKQCFEKQLENLQRIIFQRLRIDMGISRSNCNLLSSLPQWKATLFLLTLRKMGIEKKHLRNIMIEFLISRTKQDYVDHNKFIKKLPVALVMSSNIVQEKSEGRRGKYYLP